MSGGLHPRSATSLFFLHLSSIVIFVRVRKGQRGEGRGSRVRDKDVRNKDAWSQREQAE